MKFIIVSGGVLSGLGKGITVASLGLLLKSQGHKVTAIKCDMYLNVDAGTMNPIEHGEVFVTHDGLETDQDLGHYERFLDTTLTRDNYVTSGQMYLEVLTKERALEYKGACVQPYHHLPPEIINKWYKAGKSSGAEIVIIELGGTVGEYEGMLFFEAARRLVQKSPDDVCFIHVGYLPAPPSIGELKSKPIQQSISQLNALGIQPDFVVGRSEKSMDTKRKEKIALAGGLVIEQIISNPDLESIYEVALVLQEQEFAENVLKKLKLKGKRKDLKEWKEFVGRYRSAKKPVKVGIVGKYQRTGDYMLEDSYVCVIEALKHATWQQDRCLEIVWVDSEKIGEANDIGVGKILSGLDSILVPQGWGSRGVEGKIAAIKYARENSVPYLGLCFGMQMAVIEFARNVLEMTNANSYEVNPRTKYPVVHVMPDQVKYLEKNQYGGTIRLGAWPTKLTKGSRLREAYRKYGNGMRAPWYQDNPSRDKPMKGKKAELVFERHRHRYEFNNKYRRQFEKAGMAISAQSPDGKLVEAIEIPDHPFFVGTQFHPEYLSRPLRPHPIFMAFIEAAKG